MSDEAEVIARKGNMTRMTFDHPDFDPSWLDYDECICGGDYGCKVCGLDGTGDDEEEE